MPRPSRPAATFGSPASRQHAGRMSTRANRAARIDLPAREDRRVSRRERRPGPHERQVAQDQQGGVARQQQPRWRRPSAVPISSRVTASAMGEKRRPAAERHPDDGAAPGLLARQAVDEPERDEERECGRRGRQVEHGRRIREQGGDDAQQQRDAGDDNLRAQPAAADAERGQRRAERPAEVRGRHQRGPRRAAAPQRTASAAGAGCRRRATRRAASPAVPRP